METGTINSWKKEIGELVEPGDVVADIQTDKAVVDFECQDEGYFAAVLVEEGSEHPVGTPVALLVEDKDDLAKAKELAKSYQSSSGAPAETAAPAPAADSAPAASDSKGDAKGTYSGFPLPSAAILMSRHNIDPTSIKPTGPKGNIVKGDVLAALASGSYRTLPEEVVTTTETKAQPKATPAPETPAAPVAEPPSGGRGRGFKDIPLTTMRKVIASRLTESKQTVPHATTSIRCSLDAILALRKSMKSKDVKPPSLNDFVIKAVALALKEVPEANVTWDKKVGSAVLQPDVDVSVAVATPDGLITPIIKSANTLRLGDISKTMRDLATRAKDKKLLPEEFQGGSFTISNLGMFGINQFVAVINPPQACILAIGGGDDLMRNPGSLDLDDPPTAGDLVKSTMMTVTLSSDERCVDQACGSRLLSAFRGFMEDPFTML